VLRRIAKLTGGDYFAAERGAADASPSRPRRRRRAGAAPARAARRPAAGQPSAAGDGPPAGTAAAARRGGRPHRWPLARWRSRAGARARRALPDVRAPLPDGSTLPSAPPRQSPARERSAPARSDDLSATVLSAHEQHRGVLEKTITLRERPVLAITAGPARGEVFELSAGSDVSIGRSRANDIQCEDVSISASTAASARRTGASCCTTSRARTARA
jgi:hypothetical protein